MLPESRRFQRSRQRRAGLALVEMSGVVLLTGLVLSLSVTLLHLCYKTHASGVKFLQRAQTLGRLEERFRRDCLSASAATIDEGLLLKISEDITVTYQQAGAVLTRRKEVRGHTPKFDSWELPVNTAISWQLETIGPQRLMHMELSAEPTSTSPDILWLSRLGQQQLEKAP